MPEKEIINKSDVKKYLLKILSVVFITIGFVFVRQFYLDNFINGRYCFAYLIPHGGYWQDTCYDTMRECRISLKESKSEGRSLNTDNCYEQEFVDAYCVRGVKTGKTRPYAAEEEKEGEYEVLALVCTKDIKDCQKYEKYSAYSDYCTKEERVNTRESEGIYLTSQHDLESIINNNQKVKTANTNKKSGCTKYKANPNQEVAFKMLGLNYQKTKNWGAFVDVSGNLRANKESCRLIERGSIEYNKYR